MSERRLVGDGEGAQAAATELYRRSVDERGDEQRLLRSPEMTCVLSRVNESA